MDRKFRRADSRKAGTARPVSRNQAARLYDQLQHSGDSFGLHEFGIRALQAGRPDIAAEAVGKAIALNPVQPDFHYNLAIIFGALNQPEAAVFAYGCALALKPDYPEAHNNLGNALAALGRGDEARACFDRALAQRPGFAEAHYSLGRLLAAQGDRDAAVAQLRACLAAAPGDAFGAGLLLARLGEAVLPPRTPVDQLRAVYDRRATGRDSDSGYRAHHLVAAALSRHAPDRKLDILDAGCGTGRLGALLRAAAARLDGVDLSPAMLAAAARKSLYDHLEEADLVPFLNSQPARYDAIAAAATLIHFGDLAPVFAAAATALRPDGLFAFTLFPHDGADFAAAPHPELARGGCYAHAPAHVARLARGSGFRVETLDTEQHEMDHNGDPVPGLVVVLRRCEPEVRP